MNHLPLLLKREYWEHRGGFLWAPVWITGSILILTVLGMLAAEVFRSHVQMQAGFSLDMLRANIDAHDMAEAGRALDVVQLMFGGFASIGLFFVTFFYLLGALYDDRRDRSALFWKSLPISDLETVASKALTALLVIPLFTLVVATAAYVVFLVLATAWAGVHGLNALPAVLAAHPIGIALRILALLPLSALWALPAVGWLLFWSAFSRSKPFLWAVLVPAIALVANGWLALIGGPHVTSTSQLASVLGRLLFSFAPGSWFFADAQPSGIGMRHAAEDMVAHLDLGQAYLRLASPNLWLGVVAGLALLAAAVWYRGRRIETSV
jgi:ABC-2 type transport system permease protein